MTDSCGTARLAANKKTHVERSRPRLRFYPLKNRREKNLGLGKSTSTECLYLLTPDSLIFATILEGFNRSRGRLRSILRRFSLRQGAEGVFGRRPRRLHCEL